MKIHISADGLESNASLSSLTGTYGLQSNQFNGHEFFVNSNEAVCDIWFVLENLPESESEKVVTTGRVIYLTAETSYPVNYFYDVPGALDYLGQFSEIYTFHDVYGPSVRKDFPFLPWWINSNHGNPLPEHFRDFKWLSKNEEVEKSYTLSVVCSTKDFSPFHRLRLRFVESLKEHFGDNLHWFGNGINQVDEKWDALAPYKYTIAVENQIAPLCISEKLLDPFLTNTHPFYVGAPEAKGVFGKDSLTELNIWDLDKSIETIESCLERDVYRTSRESLVQARKKVLEEFHLLKRLCRIADSTDAIRPKATRRVKILSRKHLVTKSNRSGRNLSANVTMAVKRIFSAFS